MPQKVYTAKNGAKYIKMANGRCRFVKGPPKQRAQRAGKKKRKGGGLSSDIRKVTKPAKGYGNKVLKYFTT